ncbi:hypothetical protein [Coleofasciculus sp.]|uniref:hypothetical protein n=1 Tax=Coleofasciculus sp. TaxID=3100458 RepID=UPI003A242E37
MRNLLAKAFGAEKLDVGAGLGTKFRYSPITEQQNPPSSPKGNPLIPNWTTEPILFSTAIAPKKCRNLEFRELVR